jgi:putative ABC transport system permease protein
MRRAELERGTRRRARRTALLALPVIAGGAVLLAVQSRDLYTAFAGLFCVLAAGAMLVPSATMLLMRLSEAPAERIFGLPGVLAVRGVTASLSRTGVATAALAIAVATVIGVGLMIGSFRASLADWLDTTLTSDIYVSLDSPSDGVALSEAVLRGVAGMPGVRGLSLTRSSRLPTARAGELLIRAVQPGPRGWGFEVVSGTDATAKLASGSGVLLSEPFAFRHGLAVGDDLELPTTRGRREFEIVGIFRDYNMGGNSLVMSLELYRRFWNDQTLTGIGLDLEPGYDSGDIESRLRAVLPSDAGFRLRSSEVMRRISLEIFDRTFKITEVLRMLAATVAFLGVLSALLSIELERTRELAVLRSVGFAPRQLRTLLLTQTGLLGAAAGIAAAPLGTVLAALLIHVINRRSFGWTMELILSPGPIATGLALAIGAALLAGVYPALRIGRIELGAALREE